jgi:hypothetical protein
LVYTEPVTNSAAVSDQRNWAANGFNLWFATKLSAGHSEFEQDSATASKGPRDQ